MDRRVRQPQPIQLLPTELEQGVQYGWSHDEKEPPITRSAALRWLALGGFLTFIVMADVTFAVSMFVVLTDPDARIPILTALIGAVFGLPATLIGGWRLYERNRGRSGDLSRNRRRRR